MRFASFRHNGTDGYGAVTEKGIVDLKSLNKTHVGLKEIIAANRLSDLARQAEGRDVDYTFDEVTFLPPILEPHKILCVGINYPDRGEEYKEIVKETKYPNIFLRTYASMTGHNSALIRPKVSQKLDYEGEIVLVIGKAGRYIRAEDASRHIVGLTIGNEGTVRDWTRHGARSSAGGKNFDCSGSVGPWIDDAVANFDKPLEVKTWVNDELRQSGSTATLQFSFGAIIEYVSQFTTLLPGDLIFTGTPPGAGIKFDPPRFLAPGDILKIEVTGVGTLENHIADE
jgi:2-keto-4-pentenoate hydratase/2-oxohepta-3-ene-1,7-dioic acid hydratase in catechol pathway